MSTLLGRSESIVCIHGGMGREERMTAQEHDPDVKVLLATDAAGEGINLQRAHLMVNYDLPWNPNRLEQRFGRIHRIGQTEVCHLWNLVASETREGEVYLTLLERAEITWADGRAKQKPDDPAPDLIEFYATQLGRRRPRRPTCLGAVRGHMPKSAASQQAVPRWYPTIRTVLRGKC
jgi:superfamily II DNA/RNA helicase